MTYGNQLAQSLTFPGSQEVPGFQVTGPLRSEFTNVGSILNIAMPYIFAAIGMGLLVMLVTAGFSFLTSAGDSKKLDSAKQKITLALTGFLIVLVSYWLVQIAGFTLGLEKVQEIFR